MRTNYHTHTYRCGHASGNERQYIEAAIRGGYSVLGVADHSPWKFKGGYSSYMRMKMSELNGYVSSIRELAVEFESDIDVFAGLECEYYIDYIDWLREYKEEKLDYLLFGNHYPYDEQHYPYMGYCRTSFEFNLYLESSQKALESGLFECFAHPDLYLMSVNRFDERCEEIARQLCRISKNCGVTMEFNTNQEYRHDFWKIVAQVQPSVIVCIDAHTPKKHSDTASDDQALNKLSQLAITPIYMLF